MRRLLAEQPEIIRCLDDSLPEMPPPESVHHHAAREWILGIGHPLSQFAAAAFHRSEVGVAGPRTTGTCVARLPSLSGLPRMWRRR
jgi:hypothetical protein